MPRPVLVLLAALLLAPPALGGSNEPFAPSRVVVQAAGANVALVEWTPGAETADYYRVYGFDGSALSLLKDTREAGPAAVLAVAVPAGFTTYAVTGIHSGLESEPVFAEGIPIGCIRIQTDPPGVGDHGCSFNRVLKVNRPSPRL